MSEEELVGTAAEVAVRKEQGGSSGSWIDDHFHDASEAYVICNIGKSLPHYNILITKKISHSYYQYSATFSINSASCWTTDKLR